MAEENASALTAVADVDVEALPQIVAVDSAVVVLHEQANRIDVHNDVTASAAAELLGKVAKARRAAEAARVDLVKPLNDTVRKINASAKVHIAPLEAIEAALKGKVATYQDQQRREAQERQRELEEQARAEREAEEEQRRAEEAVARAEREKAAREAERARQEAERAEKARQERLAHEAGELERQINALGDEELNELASDPEAGPAKRTIARRVRAERRAAREAQEAAAAAAREAEEARAREEAIRTREALPVAAPAAPEKVGPARGGGASVSSGQRWTYELEDMRALARAVGAGEVPVEVLSLNRGEVRRMVNGGRRKLAGVRIFQEAVASVRAS